MTSTAVCAVGRGRGVKESEGVRVTERETQSWSLIESLGFEWERETRAQSRESILSLRMKIGAWMDGMGWTHTQTQNNRHNCLSLSVYPCISHFWFKSTKKTQKKDWLTHVVFAVSAETQKKTNWFLRSRSSFLHKEGLDRETKKAHGVDGESERGFVYFKEKSSHVWSSLRYIVRRHSHWVEWGRKGRKSHSCLHASTEESLGNTTLKKGTLIALQREGKKERKGSRKENYVLSCYLHTNNRENKRTLFVVCTCPSGQECMLWIPIPPFVILLCRCFCLSVGERQRGERDRGRKWVNGRMRKKRQKKVQTSTHRHRTVCVCAWILPRGKKESLMPLTTHTPLFFRWTLIEGRRTKQYFWATKMEKKIQYLLKIRKRWLNKWDPQPHPTLQYVIHQQRNEKENNGLTHTPSSFFGPRLFNCLFPFFFF